MVNFENNQFPNRPNGAPFDKSGLNDAQKPKKSPWFEFVFSRRYINLSIAISPIRSPFVNTSQRWTERAKSSQPQHSKYPRMATTGQRLTKRLHFGLRSGDLGMGKTFEAPWKLSDFCELINWLTVPVPEQSLLRTVLLVSYWSVK
jgi:hypothetical protein